MGSIKQYYAGRSVFITGGTGFVGKVLIEKLLFTCKELEKIYVLIREKEGVSPSQRFHDLKNLPVFTRIRNEMPDVLNKIVPISGDVTKDNLGLNYGAETNFMDKISVFFHAAASVKFDESLDCAMNTNFEGTRRVLQLSKRMRNLEKFVHISTAYCHTDKRDLEETIYPLPFGLHNIDHEGKIYPTDVRFEAFQKTRPNTYTIAKAMAETLIADQSEVSTVIIRPSIISASHSEPFSGWVQNLDGATGLITAQVLGLNHVILGEKNNIADLIPVDFVSNTCIAAAASNFDKDKNLVVFNCCTYSNPITCGGIYELVKLYAPEIGLNTNRSMFLIFVKEEWALKMLTFLLQKVPAYVLDSWRVAHGKKPRLIKLQTDMISNRDILKYFTSRTFKMRSDNLKKLYYTMSPNDRTAFPINPKSIQWNKYILQYCKGIKKYLLRK